MSDSPLSERDTAAIIKAIGEAHANGRVVEAVEVNPSRRLASGDWRIKQVDLISNGLLPLNRFTLKLRGASFQFDDLDFNFDRE